jgi:hypothetical protein
MVKSTWPGVSMMLKRCFGVSASVDAGRVRSGTEGRGRGRGDRDAAFLLLLHPVHGGGAVMHFADLVGLAGVVKDALGRRGLAGIDVGHDAEVAVALERIFACHGRVLRLK